MLWCHGSFLCPFKKNYQRFNLVIEAVLPLNSLNCPPLLGFAASRHADCAQICIAPFTGEAINSNVSGGTTRFPHALNLATGQQNTTANNNNNNNRDNTSIPVEKKTREKPTSTSNKRECKRKVIRA